VTVGCSASHKNTNYTTHKKKSIVGISHTVSELIPDSLYTADNFTISNFEQYKLISLVKGACI